MNLLNKKNRHIAIVIGFTLLGGAVPITDVTATEQESISPPWFHRIVYDFPNHGDQAQAKPNYLDRDLLAISTAATSQIISDDTVPLLEDDRPLHPWERPPTPSTPTPPTPSTPTPPTPSTPTPPTPATPTPPTPATPTTPTPPVGDIRPMVFADASTILDQPNTIYNFDFGSPGDVVILASNVEARNIRGRGLRRIGEQDGRSITDSGFRDFEFTFAHIHMSGGATITRPYFINGTDINPQPNVGGGDIVQIYAYQGDIIEPLIDRLTIYGKQRPPGSGSHNDGIQYAGLMGGRILNPIIRNSTILGASSAAVQVAGVYGLLTIEGSILSERYGSYHAVIATTPTPNATVLWRNNTLLDGASAVFTGGWAVHPSSNGITPLVTVR